MEERKQMRTFPEPKMIRKKRFPQAIDGFLPSTVVVPLKQEYDYTCASCVAPGQTVKEGEVIAIPKSDAVFRANIHSPVPGVVDSIVLSEMPDGKQELGIKINFAGSFSYLGKRRNKVDWKSYIPNKIVYSIAEKGVVNTFLATSPCSLAKQIESKGYRNRLLVVRLFDEAPWRLTDTLLYNNFSDEVLQGVAITAYALNATGVVLLYDKHLQKVPQVLDAYNLGIPSETIAVDAKKYLTGFSREMERIVRESLKALPFSDVSSEDLYVDTSTMLSVYSSIADDTPVVRRYITIDGDCINTYALVNVSLGMPISYAIEQCGGLAKKPAAIIINGILTGSATPSLDTPITKYVKSISLLSSHRVYDELESECTGCGNCRKICPYKLSPDILYEYVTGTRKVEDFFVKSASLCSLCNLCNSVCPARLPISQTISLLLEKTKN